MLWRHTHGQQTLNIMLIHRFDRDQRIRVLQSILIASCAIAISCQRFEIPTGNLNHYRIYLKLVPEQQLIEAKVELRFIGNGLDSLSFALHKQFEILSVKAKDLEVYQFDTETPNTLPWIPEGGNLHLRFIKPLQKGDRIRIQFTYRGKITEWPDWLANVVTEDWVELGLYLPWFPYNGSYGEFTFIVDAECDPDYQLCGLGDIKKEDNKWRFSSRSPQKDIIIVASRDLKATRNSDGDYLSSIYYVSIHDSTAEGIAQDLRWVLEHFDAWFGGDMPKEITLVESMRERGGGYTRRGLIVMAGLRDRDYYDSYESYFRYLAHETAHIWWSVAPVDSWEDWLNESFAEYSALLAVQEKFGNQAFERRLRNKAGAIPGTAPIWGFNRVDRSTQEKSQEIQILLYNKGPVLLHELATKIGNDSFLALCREVVSQEVRRTGQLLEILRYLEGDVVKNWFEEGLTSS